MGSFTFRWTQTPATEVSVRGSWDDFSRAERLDKSGDVFEKTVPLDHEKVLYKFVVVSSFERAGG